MYSQQAKYSYPVQNGVTAQASGWETSEHLISSKTMSDTDDYTNAENCHAQVIILNNVYILNVDLVFYLLI